MSRRAGNVRSDLKCRSVLSRPTLLTLRRGCVTKPKVGPLLAWRAYLGINARANSNLEEVVASAGLGGISICRRHNLFEVWEPGQPTPIWPAL